MALLKLYKLGDELPYELPRYTGAGFTEVLQCAEVFI